MAPELTTNRGQALLESLFAVALAGPLLLILLKSLLNVIFVIAVDAAVEDYFLCDLSKKTNCESIFKITMSDLKFDDYDYKIESSNQTKTFTVSTPINSLRTIHIKRVFNFEKFKHKY